VHASISLAILRSSSSELGMLLPCGPAILIEYELKALSSNGSVKLTVDRAVEWSCKKYIDGRIEFTDSIFYGLLLVTLMTVFQSREKNSGAVKEIVPSTGFYSPIRCPDQPQTS